MFDLVKETGSRRPKCLVTQSPLAHYLNHDQPPTKKRPFSTILNRPFTHTLILTLPNSLNLPTAPHNKTQSLRLSALLSNPFFTAHIKSPGPADKDFLLISISTANPYGATITLSQGILTLDLDRAIYERTGLQGKPLPNSNGRKHAHDRFRLELNLRLPNMLHGKKGFERVKWAFENVLNDDCTFLACGDAVEGLIAANAKGRTIEVEVQTLKDAVLPVFPNHAVPEQDYDQMAELLEYLHLAMLGSARILRADRVDPYFSRYSVPKQEHATTQDLVTYRWHGLIPTAFAQQVLLAAMKSCKWAAMSAEGFLEGGTYTVLVESGRSTTWEWNE